MSLFLLLLQLEYFLDREFCLVLEVSGLYLNREGSPQKKKRFREKSQLEIWELILVGVVKWGGGSGTFYEEKKDTSKMGRIKTLPLTLINLDKIANTIQN